MAQFTATGSINSNYRLEFNVNETYVSGGADNYSDVSWSLVLRATSAWNFAYIGSTCTASLNEESVLNEYSQKTLPPNSSITIASGTKRIYHNADGNKTIYCSASYNQGSISADYTPGNMTCGGNLTLTPIPRYATCKQILSSKTVNSIKINWSADSTVDYVEYSKDGGTNWVNVGSISATSGSYTISNLTPNTTYSIKTRVKRADSQLKTESSALDVTTYALPTITSSPTNLVIGNNATIQYSNPSGASMQACVCNTSGTVVYAEYRSIGSSTSGNYTFQFTSTEINNLYNAIPNDPSGSVRYAIKITVNGTTYYSSVDKTMSANENICKPTFNFLSYEESNYPLIQLTGNVKILIKGYSSCTCYVPVENKAVAKNGATMIKYRLKIGNKTNEVNYSSDSTVYVAITQVDNPTIELSAIDSRGFETKLTTTLTADKWKQYTNPTTSTLKVQRENGNGTKVLFDLGGKYWNENFGSVTNTIEHIYFRYGTRASGTFGNYIEITNQITYSNGTYSNNSGAFLPTTDNGNTPVVFAVGTEYNIQFQIADSFGNTTTYTVATDTLPLNSGNFCTDKYKDSNGIYHIGVNQLADANYDFAVKNTICEMGKHIEKALSTAGWYRVAEINNYDTVGYTCIVNICTHFSYRNTTSITLAINSGYNTAKIIPINIVNNSNIIYYAKIMREGSKQYLDIYYNTDTTNTVHIDLISSRYRAKLIDFTSGSTGTKLDDITFDGNIGIINNARGTAIKYPDGSMICYFKYRVDASHSNFNTAYGGIYHNGTTTWSYPVEFIEPPAVSCNAFLNGGIGGFNITRAPTASSIQGYMYSFTSYNFGAGNAGIDFVAIGRWR